jgi:sugar/nucleoside kinase (ribokinase family)
MLDALEQRGVDVSACLVDPALTTGATMILSSGADRAILTGKGAIGAMDIDALPETLLRRARHVHTGCFFLQDKSRAKLPAFFSAVRTRGISTSFDTNWDLADQWEGDVLDMIGACDIFFPNAAEAKKISGVDEVEDAARFLAARGHAGRLDDGPIVAVKLGSAGALACRAEGPLVRIPAFEAAVADTTGAGDSFDAAFLASWLQGGDLTQNLRWGAAAGALSTRRLGGVAGQPTIAELRAVLLSSTDS